MDENKVSVSRILIVDLMGLIADNHLSQLQVNLERAKLKKTAELPCSFENVDVLFYVLPKENQVDLTHLNKISKKSHMKIYLMTEEVSASFIPYLSFPFDGLFSLEFFYRNAQLVINTVYSTGPVLEPAMHHRLAFEIDRRRTVKKPIKQFILKNDKVEGLLKENEQKVLQLLLEGCSNQMIAQRLYFSPSTVSSTISSLLRKMDVQDRTQATVQAIRNGWVESLR
ncbi:response regulator transcription factor [Salipaludibacillus agaradhaerens]|jgi:two-component system response regulator DegU|uniref:response regulator transcription factor n=1 Tax=Salipaludibacillus agaradhaerens TaxID=76935 RepID=UPI000995E168|nr:LuxR C-terminal-related transcriptional regulator [Salipaludibacillus agaradhaerens]